MCSSQGSLAPVRSSQGSLAPVRSSQGGLAAKAGVGDKRRALSPVIMAINRLSDYNR